MENKYGINSSQDLKSCDIDSLSGFLIELQLVETLSLDPSDEGGEECDPGEGDHLADDDAEDVGHPHVHVHVPSDTDKLQSSGESFKEEKSSHFHIKN